MQTKEDLLSQAVINQIEKDIEDQEYESIDELLLQLMKSKKAKAILMDYIGDEVKEAFKLS
jgi:hypothetical protein